MPETSVPVCRVRLGAAAPEFSQITAGYTLLHARGLVRVRYEGVRPFPAGQYPHSRILQAAFGDSTVLAYDLSRGYADIPDREAFDAQLANAARYYKRDYDRAFHNEMKNRGKLRPLGLPLHVTCPGNFFGGGAADVADAGILTAEDCMSHNSYPQYRAHFVTRLSDPADSPRADDTEWVNTLRVESIRACAREFGDGFFGGLLPCPYALRRAPELVLPPAQAQRDACLRRLRENYVCAATAEPGGGAGYELAAIAAAGRAIAATPPGYSLPGEFARGKNYAAFTTPGECVEQLRSLLRNVPWIHRMEAANFSYFCEYIKPDAMVLHTLKDAGILDGRC